jgi:phage shock protein PspC (stress-responsive transcriptional regulator)
MLAGVCGGLARYFELNPAFFRVGFVVLTLLGGAGVLIYLAAALVIPEEGKPDSIAAEVLRERDKPWQLIGLGLVAVAIAALLSRATLWPRGDAAWVLVLLAGAVVLWIQRRGGARPHILRGVSIAAAVVLVLLLVAAAVVATVFHVDVRNGVGTRTYAPIVASDVHHHYRLGIGRLQLDLGRVRLPGGETDLDARVGIGDLIVMVPPGTAVKVFGHVEAGSSSIFGQSENGIGFTHGFATEKGRRLLVLDAHVGLGQLTVRRGLG